MQRTLRLWLLRHRDADAGSGDRAAYGVRFQKIFLFYALKVKPGPLQGTAPTAA
jgi:hypothetical protein